MKTLPIALSLALLGGARLVAQDHQDGHAAPDADGVAELFRGRCASCHLPPDPAFPVDRAWIHQLADTA